MSAHLSSVLWSQFNKSFTKEFLKGCPSQGTTNLQSLRDDSWSYKLRVENFFTGFVTCCFVKQDEVIELVPNFAFGLLFGLAPRFVPWIFDLVDFPASFFFLSSLGGIAKPGERLRQLPPRWDVGQKGCGGFSRRSAQAQGTRARQLMLLGSRAQTGSTAVAHGLSRSSPGGIFPDQGVKPCLLHWQADSSPLSHQGSLLNGISFVSLVDVNWYNYCGKWFGTILKTKHSHTV